jgi:serine/threonine-protein kinase
VNQKDILRFLREVRIATMMDHPNIVRVFDVGMSGPHYYYAMEDLPDRSLADEIEARGRLPEKKASEIGIQIASALGHMHKKDIVHRDVKPSNILFAVDGTVKLIDFGLAMKIDDSRFTQLGQVVGTPGYVAPEIVKTHGTPQPDDDTYALGATLYKACAGKTPFEEKGDALRILRAQAEENPEALHVIQPEVSFELSGIIMKMLARRPENRYSSVLEAHNDLIKFRSKLA